MSLYNFNAPFEPTAETPIPLFGVKLYNPIQLGADGVGQGGTLHLLRAMAKIEVECSSTYSTLESATLTRYNLSGYMAPKGVYAQEDFVFGSWEQDYGNRISVPADVRQEVGLPFTKKVSGNRSVFTLFVPEFRNLDAAGQQLAGRAQIDLTFSERPAEHYTLEFVRYVDGRPTSEAFDINRNWYYRYNVTLDRNEVNVVLDIEPYSEVLLSPDFGLDRDEKGRIIYYRSEGGGTVYLLDPDSGRCFYETADGDITWVDRIRDTSLGQYIYWYQDYGPDTEGADRTYNFYWHRAAGRWYYRCLNGEMCYVNDTFNGIPYYYDPVQRKCWTFVGGVQTYVNEVLDKVTGKVLYRHHNGLTYFLDRPENGGTGEYYYRTAYGEKVFLSMVCNGIHYLYNLERKQFFPEGTTDYVDEITDDETHKVIYRHYENLNKSFFLDRATGEYYFRNPAGDKVYVTMTVAGSGSSSSRYYLDLPDQIYYHVTDGGNQYLDIITDNRSHRILYQRVNGISYFWDSIRQKYCSRDDDGTPHYVDRIPAN